MRRIKVWRLKMIGAILVAIAGFGFRAEFVSDDCGIGLLILLAAGLWMLIGDPRNVSKILR